MLLSHQHRFIFIHIYKNAGVSISQALLPFAADAVSGMLRRLKKKPSISYKVTPSYPPHITAQSLADQIGIDRFRSYFSFAIVRNPWDWQVSLYTYMLNDSQHFQHELIRSFKNFDEYITWRCTKDPNLQKDFVCNQDGEQLVNRIGRFEYLHEDFQTICARIGIATTLPHLNKSQRRPYQEYYNDKTKELVTQVFKPDIEMFQYEFE